ncbi:MAG: sulfatase-like hydrolase/transferase [Acidobacteriota bacterium]
MPEARRGALRRGNLCRLAGGIVSASLLALLVTACGPGAVGLDEQPDVLLITVDTLRPDALGWVAGQNETPVLDRLAAEGFRFPAAVAPVPLTLPSHLSMFTGLYPRRHGVRDNGQVFAGGAETLAERLQGLGYRTAGFVSGYPLRALFGADRGFDHYDDRLPVGEEGWVERPAPQTVDAALDWVRGVESPWFLWLHFYDPHDPYDPPPELVKEGPRGRYHGEVALVDRAIGRLLAELPEGDRLTVFAADHGESLGQHREQTHGFFIYDATMLVPMVFHGPSRVAAGESQAPARLVDVAPTLLDLLGLAAFEDSDGVSLRATLEGREQEIPPAYLESRQPWITYGWAPLAAVRTADWKLVWAPRPELYQLTEDPAEANDRSAEDESVLRRMRAIQREIEGRAVVGSSAAADGEALAALRALGYLGSGGSDDEPPPGLDDPKDRNRERNQLIAAEVALRRADFAAARAIFEDVLEGDPDNRFAVLRSGIAALKAGDPAAAVPFLERAVRLDPDQPEARYALADSLTRLGELERAEEQWMETIRLQPRRVAAWANLGTTIGRRGDLERAIGAFRRAAELDPGNGRLWSNLAAAEQGVGRPAAALEHLLKAAEVWEGEFPQRAGLGVMLYDAGRKAEARRWLMAARPGDTGFVQARLRLAITALEEGDAAAAAAFVSEAEAVAPGLRQRLRTDRRFAALFAS